MTKTLVDAPGRTRRSSRTPGRKGGRPKKPNDDQLSARRMVRFSEDDNILVAERATAAGMTVSAYIRHMSLNGRVVVEQTRKLSPQAWSDLNRLGVNLNQLVRHCHEHNTLPPSGAVALLDQINEVLDAALEETDFF